VNNPRSEKQISSKYLKSVGYYDQLSQISQLELLKCAFERRAPVRMTVFGKSMIPFLRNGDVIILSSLGGEPPQIGDIVAFEQAEPKRLLIHRLIHQSQDGYEMKGDNCDESDGIISILDMLGMVTDIERKSRHANIGIKRAKGWIAWLSRRNLLTRFQRFLHHPIKLSIHLLGKLLHFPYPVE
jgi:signal peptidase I